MRTRKGKPGKKNPVKTTKARVLEKITKIKNVVATLADFIRVNELEIKSLGDSISSRKLGLWKSLAAGGVKAAEIKTIIARNRGLFSLRRKREMRRQEIYNKILITSGYQMKLRNLEKELSGFIAKERGLK